MLPHLPDRPCFRYCHLHEITGGSEAGGGYQNGYDRLADGGAEPVSLLDRFDAVVETGEECAIDEDLREKSRSDVDDIAESDHSAEYRNQCKYDHDSFVGVDREVVEE